MKRLLKLFLLCIIVLNAEEPYYTTISELKKACSDKDANSCFTLGKSYMIGDMVDEDSLKSIMFSEKSCNLGSVVGCYYTGMSYLTGIKKIKQDIHKARKFLQKACDGGDNESCFALGRIYENGNGVSKNTSKSFKLYSQACNGGHPTACMNVGVYYEHGQGIKQNFSQAKEMYRVACNGGKMIACGFLGDMYAYGLGGEQDYSKALNIYRIACSGGISRTCNSIGDIYSSGNGSIKKDLEKAYKYYTKACDGDFAEGCYALGLGYLNGNVGEKDLIKVKQLSNKACSLNLQEACALSDKINKYYRDLQAKQTAEFSLSPRDLCKKAEADLAKIDKELQTIELNPKNTTIMIFAKQQDWRDKALIFVDKCKDVNRGIFHIGYDIGKVKEFIREVNRVERINRGY